VAKEVQQKDDESDDAVDDWETADMDDIVDKINKKEVIVLEKQEEDINAQD